MTVETKVRKASEIVGMIKNENVRRAVAIWLLNIGRNHSMAATAIGSDPETKTAVGELIGARVIVQKGRPYSAASVDVSMDLARLGLDEFLSLAAVPVD